MLSIWVSQVLKFTNGMLYSIFKRVKNFCKTITHITHVQWVMPKMYKRIWVNSYQ